MAPGNLGGLNFKLSFTDDTKTPLEGVKQRIRMVKTETESLTGSTTKFTNITEALNDSLIKESNRLNVNNTHLKTMQKFYADTTDASKNFIYTNEEMGSSLNKNNLSIEEFLGKMTKVRWAMVNVALVAMTVKTIWSNLISPAVEYGMKMEQISMLTGESIKSIEDEMNNLREGTIYSLEDISEGFIEVTKRGFDFSEASQVMGAATKLSTVGFVDMNIAVDALTTTMNQFFIGADKANQIASYLAVTANRSAADINQLQESLSYVGPVAFQMNMSLEETLSVLGALHDVGIRGSMAGTSVRQALISLADPTSEATIYLQNLGATIFDAEGNFVGLTSVVEQLGFIFSKSNVQEEAEALSTVFETRTASAIAALVEQEKQLSGSLRESTKEITKQKDVLKGMNDSLNGTSYSIKEAHQVLGEFGINAGKMFRDLYATILSIPLSMADASSAFSSLNIAVKQGVLTQAQYNDIITKQNQLVMSGKGGSVTQIAAFKAEAESIIQLNATYKAAVITKEEFDSFSERLIKATDKEKMAIRGEIEALITSKVELRKKAEATKEVVDETISETISLQNMKVAQDANIAAEKNLNTWILAGSDSLSEKIDKIKESVKTIKEQIKVSYTAAITDILGIKVLEDKLSLIDLIGQKQMEMATNEVTLTQKQKDLSNKQKEWNETIKENERNLKDVREEIKTYTDIISDAKDEISKLSSMRFTGETEILGLIDKVEIFQKKQQLADLGITDAQAFLQEQLGRSGDSFDDLIAKQTKSNDLASAGSDAYNAWRESIETAIRSEIMAGEGLDKDVTSRVKTWQTQLLGIQSTGKDKETSATDSYLNKLQLAYDVYYGGLHNEVQQFQMEEQDKVNGIAEGSTQIISALQAQNDVISVNTTLLDAAKASEQSLIDLGESYKANMESEVDFIEKEIDALKRLNEQLQKEIENKKINVSKSGTSGVVMTKEGGISTNNMERYASEAVSSKPIFTGVPSNTVTSTLASVLQNASKSTNTLAKTTPTWYSGVNSLLNMASGGIVNGPTRAMIGEAGPEAVVPLRGNMGGSNFNITVNVSNSNANANDIARAIKKELNAY